MGADAYVDVDVRRTIERIENHDVLVLGNPPWANTARSFSSEAIMATLANRNVNRVQEHFVGVDVEFCCTSPCTLMSPALLKSSDKGPSQLWL